ncbi:RNA recognition motif domain-containing protein [Hirschfeldia incana]|nr:RNA recognition motif domain-containing protein [Hirschfeldia incana]
MNSLADEREEDSMPIAKPVTTTGETVLQPCSSSKRNLKRQKIHKESKANLKKQKETEEDSCCYGCEEATGNSLDTIFVKGFQHLRPRDEIKNELSNIFGSCGKVIRVFVPMQCGTCVPLGFAFIDYSNGEDDALKLNGTYMGGRKLEVKMATDSAEYYGFVNFTGCDLCRGPGKRKLRARKPLDVDKICYKNLADKAHSKT